MLLAFQLPVLWVTRLACPDEGGEEPGYLNLDMRRRLIRCVIFHSHEDRASIMYYVLTWPTTHSEPAFEPATITHDGGAATQRDQTVRDSEVAVIPRTEQVRCIEARARAFQGWRDEQWIERLRTQRYGPGGHYNHHFDWSSSHGGWGRVSSIMVWVDGSSDGQHDALKGGGTEFPLLKKPSLDERWCRFIECSTSGRATGEKDRTAEASAESGSEMVVFKPLAGNAVYWENFRPDGTGRGWDESWHAGLPVVEGTKVGLNIWTWGRID